MQPKHIIKYYALLIVSFVAIKTTAQMPSAYNVMPINYVRSWDVAKPLTDPADLNLATELKDAKITTQYVDGLGRPLQTVIKQGSLKTGSSPVDMVAPVVYDEFGREQFTYLPFAANAIGTHTSVNDGLFKLNAFDQQKSFYNIQLAGQDGETNIGTNQLNWAYSQTEYETSPLNRVLKTMAQGSSWVGAAKGVKINYWANTAADSVRMWSVTDVTNSFGAYNTSGMYPAGELYKNVTEDEHGKQVIEFKDKEGRVILKKVQLLDTFNSVTVKDDGIGRGYGGWLCTYYLYDDLGRLRAVLQPKAVELLATANSWTAINSNTDVLNQLTFRYEYDQRGRMILKKVPGGGVVHMVYDARDRLVMSQDANLRQAQQWLVTVYDPLNRPSHTYLITDPANYNNAAYHRDLASDTTAYPTVTAYTNSLITLTHYDDYEGIPSGLYSSLYNSGYAAFLTASATAPDWAEPISASSRTKGLVTWTWARILGTTTGYIESVNLYDDKGRVIQVQTYNQTRGRDVLTFQYDFSGEVLGTHLQHVIKGSGVQSFEVATRNSYDDMGRLVKVEKKTVPQAAAGWKVISSMEYDALGRLRKKKIGQDPLDPNLPLDTLTYEYNIRGWLLGMNRAYLQGNSGSKFGFELAYDKQGSVVDGGATNTYTRSFYNGNIAGSIWRSAGDGEKRKYDFDYDGASRLLKADFSQQGSGWSNTVMDFSMGGNPTSGGTMKYDANGNIVELWQKGWKVSGSDYIDKLSYTYFNGGNKLQAVADGVTTDQKLGDFTDKNTTTSDYGYDLNGNLMTDLNRRIGTTTGIDRTATPGIRYNHLNLVERVIPRKEDGSSSKANIDYNYNASTGERVRKIVVENAAPANSNREIRTYSHYVNGFVYESKSYTPAHPLEPDYELRLLHVTHEEGRMRPVRDASGNITDFVYDYFIKDHLGNVRMVLTEEQKTLYYPAATLEGSQTVGAKSMINWEKQFYTIDDTKITATSSIASWPSAQNYANHNGNPPYNSVASGSYPPDYSVSDAATSTHVYKVNATSNKTALGFVIKVMAGDRVDVLGKSYYYAPGQSFTNSNSTTLVVTDIFNALLGVPGSPAAAKGYSSMQLQGLNTGSYALPANLLRGIDGTTSSVPKAYINYIFFDEQMRYAGSGFSRVGASGQVKSHWQADPALQNISVPKNGYLYVYVSNESNVDVFFDNVQVVHKPGPIVEETHYYPFGLTMQGISSKVTGSLVNRYQFNGKEIQNKEFSDGSGLEMYDFGAREQDPQLGRWWTVDPKAEKYYSSSPYNFVDNNPITRIDPTGRDWFYYQAKGEDKKTWHYHEGNKATYTNTKGKEVKTRNGYSHLVAFVSNGKVNNDGAKMGTLVVYNQNKVQTTVPGAFTGGGGNRPVNNGLYMMRMDIKDREGPKEMNAAKDNPVTTFGAQKIPNRYIQVDGQPTNTPTMDAYDVGGAWGRGRVRLNYVDENLNIVQSPNDRGAFLHGKLRTDINYTHGCICDRSEAVFDYLWNNVNGKVPLIVE